LKKSRSINSNSWIKNHVKDYYVKKSYSKKLRSRAWFKLKEIDLKEHLLKKNSQVVDLGAFPGSWSKYASSKIGPKGNIYAYDINLIKPIKNVTFIQGDIIKNVNIFNPLFHNQKKRKIDLVMSDLAPNMSGCSIVDNVRSIELCKMALLVAKKVLKIKSFFLVKTFQGEGFNEYYNIVRNNFLTVKTYKPLSSRSHSREIFLLASGLKKNNSSSSV